MDKLPLFRALIGVMWRLYNANIVNQAKTCHDCCVTSQASLTMGFNNSESNNSFKLLTQMLLL